MNCPTSSYGGTIVKILVLEPYYGGSHRTFLDGLQAHIPFEFTLLTLPARNWKWRMRLAAPFFADKIPPLCREKKIDLIFCSSFVDVATLHSLLPAAVRQLPLYTYFHENQFAYPVRKEDERDFHFGLTNLTSILASDQVAFSTGYNMQTFLEGVEQIQRICPDMKFRGLPEKIAAKAMVLNPGIDFSAMDRTAAVNKQNTGVPVIVWNHRWEHDKNPQEFFQTLLTLDADGLDFKAIILGQAFRKVPAIFSEAQERLQHRIIHYGFVESRDDYARLLRAGDIVVSTARHEFYGMSVIEAVRAGCCPVLPARLSYPELFPAEYLYEDGCLGDRLRSRLENRHRLDMSRAENLTAPFSWPRLRTKYMDWFEGRGLVATKKEVPGQHSGSPLNQGYGGTG
jgi:glycosyltransferase involved in cell wall biosynthesis